MDSTPSWRTATFAGGATAQQIIRIQNAWDCVVAPLSPTRDAAVSELLRAAGDAGWSPDQLTSWIKQRQQDIARARSVVLDELAARRAARRQVAA